MSKFTRWELKLILRYGSRCYYCEREFSFHPQDRPTLEHRTPKSQGGKDLTVACYRCNHMKGDMTEREFLRYRELLKVSPNKRVALLTLRKEFPNVGEGC